MTKTQLLGLTLSSGILLAVPWFEQSGLVLCFAFLPLLFVEAYFYQHRNIFKSHYLFLYSFLAFLVWNALSTWWLCYATKSGAIFFVLMNSFLMALIWWGFHWVKRKRGRKTGVQFLMVAWLSFEYLHHNWGMSFPGLTLGNGFSNEPLLVQWYEFTGTLGGSAWVLLINFVLFRLISNYLSNGILKRKQALVAVLVFTVPILFSVVLFYSYSEKENPVRIVIAQPNIDPFSEKFGEMPYAEQYHKLLAASDSLGNEHIDFFIGPETALHQINEKQFGQDEAIQKIVQFLKKYPKAAFVVGATGYNDFANNESEFYNSAYLISGIDEVQTYHKSKLVTGVEKMPFEKYFRFLEKYTINLGDGGTSYTTQGTPNVFTKDSISLGVPICYESAYGEYVSKFVLQGAQFIAVITNDGWFKKSPGTRLHLALSQLRAIENRRSIARCGNTGISCFINQRGEITSRTKLNTRTAIKGTINRNDSITIYTKYGDYIGRISMLLLLLMLLKFWVEKTKGRMA